MFTVFFPFSAVTCSVETVLLSKLKTYYFSVCCGWVVMSTDSYLGAMSGCRLWATSFKVPVTFGRKCGTLVTFCNTPHIEHQKHLDCKDKSVHSYFTFCYSAALVAVLLCKSSIVSGHWCLGLMILRPQTCLSLWFRLHLCLIFYLNYMALPTHPS